MGRFDQVGAGSGVNLDSCAVVIPKLGRMSGALSLVMVFGPSFHSKNWAGTYHFFFLRLIKIATKLLPSFLKNIYKELVSWI